MVLCYPGLHEAHRYFLDLHLGNVLIGEPVLDSYPLDKLWDFIPPPQKEPIQRIDGVEYRPDEHLPAYAVRRGSFPQIAAKTALGDARALITGFGDSWSPSIRHRFSLYSPAPYLPPEASFAALENRPISFSSDIWTLGVSIFAVFAPRDLFEVWWADVDDLFADAVSLLGMPPKEWWNNWKARKEYFDNKGKWIPPKKKKSLVTRTHRSWKVRMAQIEESRAAMVGVLPDLPSQEEMNDLQTMLESMVRWRPESRATAEQLAEGKWMQKWGRPAIERMEKVMQMEGRL